MSFSAIPKSRPGAVILDGRARPPTEIQLVTLEAFERFVVAHGFPPSLRDLAIELDVQWNAARDRVATLVKRGLLDRAPNKSRSVALSRRGRFALAAFKGAPTPGTFVRLWRCTTCETVRAGAGDCPECKRGAA